MRGPRLNRGVVGKLHKPPGGHSPHGSELGSGDRRGARIVLGAGLKSTIACGAGSAVSLTRGKLFPEFLPPPLDSANCTDVLLSKVGNMFITSDLEYFHDNV